MWAVLSASQHSWVVSATNFWALLCAQGASSVGVCNALRHRKATNSSVMSVKVRRVERHEALNCRIQVDALNGISLGV